MTVPSVRALTSTPLKASYDVVIVGGAIMGSSTAWFLTENPDFKGTVLVVERDASYEKAATSLSESCIRQQFSTEPNIRISQFGGEFFQNMRRHMGNDERVPELAIHNFGYLYLASDPEFAEALRSCQKVQAAAGAGTEILSPQEIKARYPFYNVDDLVLGSINTLNEGYFDGYTMFDWWRRIARERGVEYLSNEVVSIQKNAGGDRVESVTLKTGEIVVCGQLVNASGTRGARTAAMAGISLPIEPRKRYAWIFKAENPLPVDLPLTIDPGGAHVREHGGGTYLAGGYGAMDPAADPEDFTMDHQLWEDHIWPVIATRIPQFESVKVTREWVGQYDFNVLDQNAITGPHPHVKNFIFLNGFSGHGLQQSPAMGRGTSEWLTYGEYRSLDLSPFHYERVMENRPFLETAII
jgi:glycine/D-amino acid oxidase-like deaminating enzyme